MTIIHQIAQCQDCDWECSDYLTANRKAHYHKKKTNHRIIIETGTYYEI